MASDAVTSFSQDMGVDRRCADVFGEDNQRLPLDVLQCQAFFVFSGGRAGSNRSRLSENWNFSKFLYHVRPASP